MNFMSDWCHRDSSNERSRRASSLKVRHKMLLMKRVNSIRRTVDLKVVFSVTFFFNFCRKSKKECDFKRLFVSRISKPDSL